jgi:hypothetical protein
MDSHSVDDNGPDPMDSHGEDDNGDCPTIDWATITSMVPYYGLDDLPDSVRNFYLVSQVVANAAVCPRHKMNLLAGYLNSLDDASYWCIPAFCEPDFFKVPGDIASASVDNCLLWMDTLAAKWPLPASIFTSASMSLLLENDIWMEVFFLCSGCMSIKGQSKDELWRLSKIGGTYLMTDGCFTVDGFQGESPENDLLTVLEKVDAV